MKRVKLIINPSSGRQAAETKIDYLCKLLLDNGYILGKYYTEKKNDAVKNTIKTCKNGEWDLIIACGGDGTINEVATGMANSKNKLPVAIFPTGTVNDFANYINMPSKVPEFFNMIEKMNVTEIDLGKMNDRYFVNVAAGGLLTDVGYQVPVEAKALLGRMAYYFEGLRVLISEGIKPIQVSFKSKEYTSDEKILLFLVSNSSSIGGFKKIAPDADVLDGLLDVLIIKDAEIPELANIFFNILKGDHIKHPKVVYFKTNNMTIKSNKKIMLDIDGETGGKLPAKFEALKKGMKIITNREIQKNVYK